MQGGPERTIFLYWGRRGGAVRLALEAARAALSNPLLDPTFSISTSNERFGDFAAFGERLFPVETFSGGAGALLSAWRLPMLRRAMAERLLADRITTAVTILPHVWSPLTNDVLRSAGVRTYNMVHDVDPHPGDNTAALIEWCHRDLSKSDRLITLSQAVATRLTEKYAIPPSRILPLFHPAFEAGGDAVAMPAGEESVRLLFIGRIMPYKGLGLLVDAVEQLSRDGLPVELGVFGEGDISAYQPRLERLGATIVNRWLSDAEIDAAVASHHVMALPYVEASQSGVAGLAMGRGLPIVATPVGGLREQITDGASGILADAVDPTAFAAAIRRLVTDRRLLADLARNARGARSGSSMNAMMQLLAEDIVAQRCG